MLYKLTLLKWLDGFCGRLLVSALPGSTDAGVREVVRRVLFIRPGGIGDAVLLVPTIRAFQKVFPDTVVDILAERRNREVFTLCPGIGRILIYDHPRDLLAVLWQDYDLIIDSEQWHRLSAVVARLNRAPMTIGFSTNARRRMFTHAVPYSQELYEVQSFMQLLAPLGIAIDESWTPPFLDLPHEANRRAEMLLAPIAGKNLVVIAPGASIAERRWGAARFRLVVQSLAAQGVGVVIVGGPGDRAAGDEIVSGGGLNLAGRTTLAETAAVIARSALFVGGDSGVLHIAVGLNIPTVSLFGPGIAVKWAPRNADHLVINRKISCSPCTRFGYTPKCAQGLRCLREIDVAEVIAGVLSKLQGPKERRN